MFQPISLPEKSEIQGMPLFKGLELNQIFVVTNKRQADCALNDLLIAKAVGFDTEAKPTFRKGEKSTGPHVFQFATSCKAYLFQSRFQETVPTVLSLLNSSQVQKIGFGLRGDRQQLANKFGITPESMIDLDQSFKKMGYRNSLL